MFFQKKKLAKHCAVYISEKHDQIIITPQHINEAGIFFEQEESKVLSVSANVNEIGARVIEALHLFSKKDSNRKESKLSDWPSFKISRSKTVRSFEQEYIRISIGGCNEHNLLFNMEGAPYKNSELKIKTTMSFHADPAEIGNRILKVYHACLNGHL